MKINQLETLILNQLGTTKPQILTTNSSYPTPVVSQPQKQLEVRDPRGQKQSIMANSNQRPAQPIKQINERTVSLPQQNNNTVVNQPSAVTTQQSSEIAANESSTYTLKIDSILKSLIPGKDFCQLPGVKNSVLLRSGLVKILRALNYKYSFKLVDKQLKDGVLTYSIEATIVDSDGCFIGSAIGSSNSGEKKFADKGLSSDNILSAIASTRALRSAVKDILVR